MKFTYKYRIFPTKTQQSILKGQLETCRFLYNHLLEIRESSWEKEKKSMSHYDTQNLIPKLKEEFPQLKSIYSQVLQNVSMRVDLAYQGFFRRLKRNENPGYPRIKGPGRYKSICYPQYGNGCKLEKNKLSISKIGDVFVELHRPIKGTPKTITIIREPTGKWFVCFSCTDVPGNKKPFPKTNKECGIDVGISSFATFDDGNKIENPHFFETEEKELSKKQEQEKWKVVTRIHERIRNKRNEFLHKTTNDILKKYDFISIEDVNTNSIIRKRWNKKRVYDVAWSNFANILSYKAESAGKIVVKVNPAYTSQTCSNCGTRKVMKENCRIYECSHCGMIKDRDENAAINILRLGTQSHVNR